MRSDWCHPIPVVEVCKTHEGRGRGPLGGVLVVAGRTCFLPWQDVLYVNLVLVVPSRGTAFRKDKVLMHASIQVGRVGTFGQGVTQLCCVRCQGVSVVYYMSSGLVVWQLVSY